MYRKTIISLILFIFLSGCASFTKNNFCPMPPPQKKSAVKIQSHYRKFGKTYAVLSSSKNYEEQGLASWYGRRFHRKRTTSGERYNMYQLTAAHKTLPFSSRVLVTNLKNGKHVIVRINDRGPFVRNRLIDLSYAAAKKLGMLGHGTVPVMVKAAS